MEFDTNNTPPAGDISDAERLAASNRRLELTPLHMDVQADELPDDVIATQHIVQGATANIPNESEATNPSAVKQPEPVGRKSHRSALVAGILVTAVTAGLSVYVLINR